MNIGCMECGVSSDVVGIYDTKDEAEAVASKQEGWRDGGQSVAKVFEIEL